MIRRRRLVSLLVAGAVLAAASVSVAEPSRKEQRTAIEGLIESYRPKGLSDVDVLVARHGEPVVRAAFGMADRERGAPNTPDTEFRVGSVTKQFTAFAILDLVEQGKLSLDDPISQFIANTPAAWRDVTVRQLLTHTSGIPDFNRIPEWDVRLDRPAQDLVAFLHERPLEAAPGAKFAYDNSGYVLLGLIVEKASGRSLGAYLQTRAFAPLHMRHAGFVSETPPPGSARGYVREGAVSKPAPWMSNIRQSGAGALYSTVDDLLLWDRALHGGKLLSAPYLAMMFADQGHGFGFGEVLGKDAGRRVWWHNGHVDGYSAMLARYPDDDLTIIILSNDEAAPVERLSRDIATLYLNVR